MKNKKTFFIGLIFLILTLVVDGFLIYQSILNAPASTEWSSPVVETAADVVNTIKENTINDSNYSWFSNFIRKLFGHFGLFGLSSLLTTFAIYFLKTSFDVNKKNRLFSLLISLIPLVLLAIFTEFIQTTSEGRFGCITDVLIDSSGGILGSIIATLFTLFDNKRYELV